ncbi:MAG: LPP20 family lipoprotein [Brevinematales bacterium]|nr:LPP20 family lipoprotein [Brevinematales bacterium]
MKKWFILLFLFSFVFGAEPSWVTNPKKDAKFYYFVGYSEDIDTLANIKDKAFYNAKTKIATSIFEETEVSKIFSTYGNISGDVELQRNYTEEIKSKSTVQLTGVEIEDFYYEEIDDDGLKFYKVWVLAKISKTNFENERNRILAELKRKLELVDKNLELAESELKNGNIIASLDAYYTAALSSIKVKERRDEFVVYISKMTKILQNIQIAPSPDNPKQIDSLNGGNIKFNVLYQNKVPIANAKVNFILRNNKGNISRQAISSSDGIVSCNIESLSDVNNNSLVYARLALDFPELSDLEPEYKTFYNTLLDAVGKVNSSYTFSVISSRNKKLATTVIAVIEEKNSYKIHRNLTSEAQSILISKGYSIKKFPSGIDINDLVEMDKNELSILEQNGIKQALVVVVSGEDPLFNETLNRYIANYNLSLQLIDVASGEIINSKSSRVTVTSATERGISTSFLSVISRELKKLIK